jgi:hypothetical protein
LSAELAIAAGHIREAYQRLQLGIDQLGQCPEGQELMVHAEFQRDRIDVLHRLTLGAIERSRQAEAASGRVSDGHARPG